MLDYEITSVQFNRPCPVCDGVMELSSIDSEPWSPRTMGEASEVLLCELRDDAKRLERHLRCGAEHRA
jgi:hypothetical protein